MWSSPTNDLALAGQTKRMKCIFSGYPTPNVTWTRLDRELPARIEYPQKGIHVDVSDQGVYECKGKNARGEERVVVRLTVESTPYWKDGRGPEEVNTSEDENATITCHAEGIPKPDVQFFINGESLKNLPDSPKRIFDAEKSQLTFLSVSSLDTRVAIKQKTSESLNVIY
ncbi:hypothetical protein HELRODRAFT_177608 [Helobdella robusta]|uniref:Ig-like domain-containing protein n=1 Tax=Helobdella robusta TaxID=6412 RepID=T1FBX9_HELRO|nr:hypothetical protein HELRODRAFT_177608 [Helobdella robusta]ESN97944.1 hypothetical protein HELRODRAFT_177608 [Helobdella robusta]